MPPFFAPASSENSSPWKLRRSGRYYSPFMLRGSTSASVVNAGLAAFPFYCAAGVINSLAAHVTTLSAGSTFRIGAYRNIAATFQPGALIADSGVLSGASTGVKEAPVSFNVAGGEIIWLASIVGAGAPSFVLMPTNNNQEADYFGQPNTTLSAAQTAGYNNSSVIFGPLPDPFTLAGIGETTSGSHILVAVKYA